MIQLQKLLFLARMVEAIQILRRQRDAYLPSERLSKNRQGKMSLEIVWIYVGRHRILYKLNGECKLYGWTVNLGLNVCSRFLYIWKSSGIEDESSLVYRKMATPHKKPG